MDVIALVKEGFQSAAEHAASYKTGQTVLRHVDKALWVVEKCARWAVPPPLDPEERPQPELVRPLPWVFFLMMLVALRVARESISLVNLVLGKPPLRSADVVTYIQGKRRYLRTLKYQGNRIMRARTGTAHEPWFSGLQSLFEFTMCFRRQSVHYGNNNTTRVSNNDEVLVVKRSKRPRQEESPVASTSEASMERLIEKMMVDLDADSDEDSSYTLTNATSIKSDRSGTAESDHESTPNDVTLTNDVTVTNDVTATNDEIATNDVTATNPKPDHNEPPKATPEPENVSAKSDALSDDVEQTPSNDDRSTLENNQTPNSTEETTNNAPKRSPMKDSEAFIEKEKHPTYQRSPKRQQKMANGRTVKSTSERNIGGERREAAVSRAASAEFANRERKENFRKTP